jgi:hypothetical protein
MVSEEDSGGTPGHCMISERLRNKLFMPYGLTSVRKKISWRNKYGWRLKLFRLKTVSK